MLHALSTFKYSTILIGLLLLALGQLQGVRAVKFKLQAERYPQPRCIWNSAHDNELVIVTANIGSGALPFTFDLFVEITIVLINDSSYHFTTT
jgi:hypothetical protein